MHKLARLWSRRREYGRVETQDTAGEWVARMTKLGIEAILLDMLARLFELEWHQGRPPTKCSTMQHVSVRSMGKMGQMESVLS